MKKNDLQRVWIYNNIATLNGDGNQDGNSVQRRIYTENGREYFKFDRLIWFVDELPDWGISVERV